MPPRSWSDITARVQSLAFNLEGTHLAAASLDESVRVYSLARPSATLVLKNLYVLLLPLLSDEAVLNVPLPRSHRGGARSALWAGPSKLATAGADGTIRILEVKL